jgi:hypothetical protein
MAYVNPQLQEQTTDMILLLKEWVVNTSQKIYSKEKYAGEECGCCWRKLALGNSYVSIMECYAFNIYGVDKLPTDYYNCLTEAELRLVLQKSKKLTISDC